MPMEQGKKLASEMGPAEEPYISLPIRILKDSDLSANAKLLYGLITALSQKCGYCYATNRYLSEKLGLKADTITKLISELAKKGHINTEAIRNEKGAVCERRITLAESQGNAVPLPDEYPVPSPMDIGYPPGYSSDTLPDKYPGRINNNK